MRIARWSEIRFVFVCQLVEVITEADTNETSGEDPEAILLLHHKVTVKLYLILYSYPKWVWIWFDCGRN